MKQHSPKPRILIALDNIRSSAELNAEFRKAYTTEYSMVEACIKGDMIKPEALKLIMKLGYVANAVLSCKFCKRDEEIRDTGTPGENMVLKHFTFVSELRETTLYKCKNCGKNCSKQKL